MLRKKRIIFTILIVVISLMAIVSVWFVVGGYHKPSDRMRSRLSAMLIQADSLLAVNNIEKAMQLYHGISEIGEDDLNGDKDAARIAMSAALMDAQLSFQFLDDYGRELRALKRAADLSGTYGFPNDGVNFLYGVLYYTVGSQNDAVELIEKASEYFIKVLEDDTKDSNAELHHYAATNLLFCDGISRHRQNIGRSLDRYFSRSFDNDSLRLQDLNRNLQSMISFATLGEYGESMRIGKTLCGQSSIHVKRVLPGVYFLTGEIAMKSGNPSEALQYYSSAESLIDSVSGHDMLLELYESMSKAYQATGNDFLAGRYAMLAADKRHVLTSFSQISSIRSAENDEEVSSITDDLKEERAKANYLRRILLVGGMALTLLLILSIVLFWLHRRLKEAYRLLYVRYSEMILSQSSQSSIREAVGHRASIAMEVQAKCSIEDSRKTDVPESGDGGSDVGAKDDIDADGEVDAEDEVDYSHEVELISTAMDTSPEVLTSEFSAAALSVITGIKARMLTYVINQVMNTSFRTLVNARRIREVCVTLESSDLYDNWSLDAIAESVGIKSRTTFNSAFKKETGMTPSQYLRFVKERKAAAEV